jgi:hypothetical protein
MNIYLSDPSAKKTLLSINKKTKKWNSLRYVEILNLQMWKKLNWKIN